MRKKLVTYEEEVGHLLARKLLCHNDFWGVVIKKVIKCLIK